MTRHLTIYLTAGAPSAIIGAGVAVLLLGGEGGALGTSLLGTFLALTLVIWLGLLLLAWAFFR